MLRLEGCDQKGVVCLSWGRMRHYLEGRGKARRRRGLVWIGPRLGLTCLGYGLSGR